MTNPLVIQRISAFGTTGSQLEYYEYIWKIMDGRSPKYQPEFNKWIITPYLFSTLHLLTYYNLYSHLDRALNTECLFIESRQRVSPLTLCLCSRSYKLVDYIIAYLAKKAIKNPDCARFLENNLVMLNKFGTSHLTALYSKMFVEKKFKVIPEYCDVKVRLPIVRELKSPYSIDLDLFLPNEEIEIGQPVTFKQFLIPMIYTGGTKESILFLDSLINCHDTAIFKTEFIQLMLEWKWEQVRYVAILQSISYVCFLVSLGIYVALSLDFDALIGVIIMNNLLFIYEIYQMIVARRLYFKDYNNYLDMGRTVLINIYGSITI